MKRYQLSFIGLLPVAALFFAAFAGHSSSHGGNVVASAAPPACIKAPHPASPGFAVIELFTSEGCSSCPPADKALAQVAGEYPDQVYVLGFHVDYWNRLGWKDIYSAAGYTQRQKEYAGLFNLQSIYTPEAVVNGRKEFVGSDQAQLQSAIKEELATTANHSLHLAAVAPLAKKVILKYEVTTADAGATLQIALVQSRASSQVLGGENQGLRLQHINVVRDFQSIPARSGLTGNTELTVPDGLSAKDCKVIAFLQDKDGHITGAGTTTIDPS
jgi:hypothetical protein